MKHPLTIILVIVVLVLLATTTLIYLSGPKKPLTITDLPWMVELSDKGNPQVLGITLGESTLQEAVTYWKAVPTIAYFKGGDDPGSMEAYFSKVRLGPIEARIIAQLSANKDELEPYAKAAINPQAMPSGAYRYTLPEEEYKAAHDLKVTQLTYIPTASLDQEMVTQRFGQPEQLKELDEKRSLWLYPDKRLGLLMDDSGKESLQYTTKAAYPNMAEKLLELE